MSQAAALLMIAFQGREIDYLTRHSPPPPDWETLVYALSALAAACVILWIRQHRLKRAWPRYRCLMTVFAVASFFGCGVFICSGLVPRMLDPPGSFTREPHEQSPPVRFERFLREISNLLPEHAGVFLVNTHEPYQVNMTNYFLYPRRVFYTQLSAHPISDPAAQLNAETCKTLRAMGAEWILDLSPDVLNRGARKALLPVPRTRNGAGR
jgi:hypothetical protein